MTIQKKRERLVEYSWDYGTGCKGYNNMTDKEIEDVYSDIFGFQQPVHNKPYEN